MMKTKLIILSVMFVCNYSLFADIAPNPIRAKGIVTSLTTDIRMVSEKVTVDLFQDHSEVECLFFMKNEGEKQLVNIGFPEMSFHHFTITRTIESGNSFMVLENEKKVELIDLYNPSSTLPKDVPEFDKQPWYLWFSEFNEGETKIIKVRYTLPFGVIKNSATRYFTYLLNTGYGWKGSIDTAEVIVNLKDIPADSLIETTPSNYKIGKNQITWKFYNLEPTLNDDIKIFYKSLRVIKEKRLEPKFVLNEKIVPGFELNSMRSDDILAIKVLKDLKVTRKYTSGSEGVVLIYTYDYAIDKCKNLIASRIQKKLKYDSSSDFMKKYKLIIDTTAYENKEFLLKVLELKEDEIKDVKIKKEPGGKTCIQMQKL